MSRTDKLFYAMQTIIAVAFIAGLSFKQNELAMSIVKYLLYTGIGLDIIIFISLLKDRKTSKQ